MVGLSEDEDKITADFVELSDITLPLRCDQSISSERFTCLMYKHTTNAVGINETRREMLVKESSDLENIHHLRPCLNTHFEQPTYQNIFGPNHSNQIHCYQIQKNGVGF